MARVLMTADAVGGVWTYALELARALALHDLETTIATMGPEPSRDQIRCAHEVPGLDLVTSRYALEWMDDPWADVERSGEWLLDLEATVRPIAVHLNGYAHGALPWRAPVIVVGHSCLLSWAERVGGDFPPGVLERYRRAASAGIQAADWVVAPSAAMLSRLQHHYGPFHHGSVIANGRDPARFHSTSKEPLILSAGRLWDGAKNVVAVAEVVPRLAWPVVIAGCETIGGVGRLAEHELASWLARASVFALPARYEPFGLLPLEAALSGCALVLGDIDSLREVWGDAALFVDPCDRDALTGALESLIASPERLQDYAARARQRALMYTPERMAEGYLALYRNLSAGPQLSARKGVRPLVEHVATKRGRTPFLPAES